MERSICEQIWGEKSVFQGVERMTTLRKEFFASVNVNIDILELLHSGIAIFNHRAKLMFANATYKKMYRLDDTCMGLDAMEFFLRC